MDNDRLYFIFYRSFLDALEEMPIESQLPMFKAISRYALDGIEPVFSDSISKVVWKLIQPTLSNHRTKFLNGKKGGAPEGNTNATKKQPRNNQETTKKQPRNNLYKNKNENENENKNKNENNNNPLPPSKGKGGVSPSLLTKAKSLFRKSYEEIEHQPYAWTKKDERAMESLIGKLQYCYPNSTDKEILNFLDRLVENSVCNQWVSENLSVSILDLKFNEINKLQNA